jgi:predicted amidohydrolase
MRVGVFQCAGGGLTPHERLARLAAAIGGGSFDLVVCPELFMSGYNVGEALHELAEPRGGSFSRRAGELASRCGTAIVYGYPERDGDLVYNSAACVGADGETVANHRKTVLPPGFEPDHFAPGEGMTLFALDGVRCAILICYEAEFPESVRAAAEAGAQVVIVPTALSDRWPLVAHQMMPTRAFENGVWLLYANHAGRENGTTYLGASCLLAPDGQDIARAGASEEFLAADLDMARVTAAQDRLPYVQDVKRLRRSLSDKTGS